MSGPLLSVWNPKRNRFLFIQQCNLFEETLLFATLDARQNLIFSIFSWRRRTGQRSTDRPIIQLSNIIILILFLLLIIIIMLYSVYRSLYDFRTQRYKKNRNKKERERGKVCYGFFEESSAVSTMNWRELNSIGRPSNDFNISRLMICEWRRCLLEEKLIPQGVPTGPVKNPASCPASSCRILLHQKDREREINRGGEICSLILNNYSLYCRSVIADPVARRIYMYIYLQSANLSIFKRHTHNLRLRVLRFSSPSPR